MTATDATAPGRATDAAQEWASLAPRYPSYEVLKYGAQGRDQKPVRSIDRTTAAGRAVKGRLLAVSVGTHGYLQVKLYNADGKQETKTVHSLILYANVGPLPDGMETRHLGEDQFDNRWAPGGEAGSFAAGGRLVYGTKKQNHADQVAAGTATKPEHPCVMRCGREPAAFKDARCPACMTDAGVKASGLLADGMPLSRVTRRCRYKSDSWTFAVARDFGGYRGTIAQARAGHRKPLLRQITGWFRRDGER